MKVRFLNFYKPEAMKIKSVTIIVILALTSSMVLAQNPNQEKLNAYKIAFFTRKLNLTPGEAEKFWPLYNEYQDKKIQIQKERVQLNRRVNQEGATLSEQELIAAADKLIELQVVETELAVTFHKHLKGVLPPAKVIKVYQAENQFRMQLLKQIQERNPPGKNLKPQGN
jgi:hypothetical protein